LITFSDVGYGLIEPAMIEALRPLVASKIVWDLGPGSLNDEPIFLLRLGAREVLAVDKEGPFRPDPTQPEDQAVPRGVNGRLRRITTLFYNFATTVAASASTPATGPDTAPDTGPDTAAPDVAFLKWPSNVVSVGLPFLLSRAPIVVYIGLNDGRTACGDLWVWEHLHKRPLLCAIRGEKNDMLVYGPPVEVKPGPPRCREELNSPWGEKYYEEKPTDAC
jgi:hypothetical protein